MATPGMGGRKWGNRKKLKGCTCGVNVATKEQIAPGITRIHGNLCNVHGRYGPCDASQSGKKRGAGKLKINVGSLPSSIGPGLAYMYDAALQTLRSTDEPIKPELINARAIRFVERSLDTVLPLIGSTSVTAGSLRKAI